MEKKGHKMWRCFSWDDKNKLNFGVPGEPLVMATTKRAGLAIENYQFVYSDHDMGNKSSAILSVVFGVSMTKDSKFSNF